MNDQEPPQEQSQLSTQSDDQQPPQEQPQLSTQGDGQGEQKQENEVGEARPRPRRPRIYYSRAQQEKAVQMLDNGMTCRKVARKIGPPCNSGTPIRWRQVARRQQEARRRFAAMFQRDRNNNASGRSEDSLN